MNGIRDIIRKLDQQRTAIERALSALREMDGHAVDGAAPAVPAAPGRQRRAKRKGGMTPEGRKRLSEALKARWAAKRAGAETAPAKTKRAGRK
jgi:hypothetical protein